MSPLSISIYLGTLEKAKSLHAQIKQEGDSKVDAHADAVNYVVNLFNMFNMFVYLVLEHTIAAMQTY